MKTIVMYYTLGGTSRQEAEIIAHENNNIILCEVKELKKRNLVTAFLPGCPHAMKRLASDIQPIEYNLNDFDRIVIVAPIWAGFPVPAFNSIVNELPKGKEVELYFCSGGGEAPKSEEGTKKLIAEKGCKLIGYHNIKTSKR